MPKMKTHQGAAGRFEVRKKGRLKRWRAGHNHMLEKKSRKQKRRLNGPTLPARTRRSSSVFWERGSMARTARSVHARRSAVRFSNRRKATAGPSTARTSGPRSRSGRAASTPTRDASNARGTSGPSGSNGSTPAPASTTSPTPGSSTASGSPRLTSTQVLADLAVTEPEIFGAIVAQAKNALDGKPVDRRIEVERSTEPEQPISSAGSTPRRLQSRRKR